MAYKQKSSGLPFKQLGSSPAKHYRKEDKSGGNSNLSEQELKEKGIFVRPKNVRHNDQHDDGTGTGEHFETAPQNIRVKTDYEGTIGRTPGGDTMDKAGFDKFGNPIEGYVAPPTEEEIQADIDRRDQEAAAYNISDEKALADQAAEEKLINKMKKKDKRKNFFRKLVGKPAKTRYYGD